MYEVSPVQLLIAFLFIGLLTVALIGDIQTLRIPNRISLALVGLFPAHVLASPGTTPVLSAVVVACVVLAVGIVVSALGMMGGGDAKLLAATMLWAGPEHAIDLIWVTGIAGAVVALVMVTRLRFPLAGFCDFLGQTSARDVFLGRAVPYGIAIAIGGYAVVGRALLGLPAASV
jgi:prepilin peptidase CpaA